MQHLMEVFLSICVLSIFILIGKTLRVKVKLFQFLFLPSSIIAGFIALLIGPEILGRFSNIVIFPDYMLGYWRELPGILINVVFASLFLGVTIPNPKKVWKIAGPQLCYGSVVGLGQYFFSLLVTLLILIPLFDVPAIFSCIVEIGFSGGHGTAAGMRNVFRELGFEAGGALGQMSATVGIIVAVVIGIALINVAIRKNYCAFLNEKEGIPTYKKVGLIPKPKRYSIATATVASEAIEPMTFHFAIISVSILLGWAILYKILPWLLSFLPPSFNTITKIFKYMPLFPFAMIGGILVQLTSMKFNIDNYYDKDTFDRLLGLALDILVISAIASIRLDLILDNIWPFLIIMLSGIIWVVLATVVIAPRMFPEFWFERSITEFGMQTGVTAIGLMLLRIVDPLYKTGTASAFGFKQLLYQPFLGGGFLTVLAPIIISQVLGAWPTVFVTLGLMLVFIAISWFNGWVDLNPKFTFQEQQELGIGEELGLDFEESAIGDVT
ncbi:MAG: sodium/glutamate symporter [Vulcanimicrobiota bacterium]